MSESALQTRVYIGAPLAAYGFGGSHPFGCDRHDAFWSEACQRGLDARVASGELRAATDAEMEAFHTRDYLKFAAEHCRAGIGFLDSGDTPAEPGVFEAARQVAGATLNACEDVVTGRCRRAFVPIGGLHHAARNHAAGFCALNDIGIAIEMLRARHGVERIAYVDIDAHHGDGVFYAYEDDPALIFVDLHEDGRTLYPGTGSSDETGRGAAAGTKLNIPMPAGSDDDAFRAAWPRVEDHLERHRPEFVLLQCGADSLAGDPITHLRYSAKAHAHAARSLKALAETYCDGRLVAMGGGGYNRQNLAAAWCAVLEVLAKED
ncbi:MAG TPA: acetoin utilization protein AcuC [Gammaproteobacteria bacterium]|nr:acetoin utilization protein AcuC [Gammaproteobacteria bacterium]